MAAGRASWESWGRTRCPKNVTGTHGDEAVTATGAPSGATAGYATENQRFLHMFLDTSIDTNQNALTVTVYGYNYAFGAWMPLAETGVAGTAITIAATDAQAHKIVDIAGTDRVYFKVNEALLATNKFFAACSSF